MRSSKLLFQIVIFLTIGGWCQSMNADSMRCPFAITDGNGRKVPSETASLTVGKGGPMLLQDSNYLNYMAHFDRERIPERVVHAKGQGAHGYFEVTHDITKYTKAAVFSRIGQKTKIFARFSATAGQSGAPDPVIDTRGLAVKFYTTEGNWDLTCLSTTVFSIRDPILFPSVMRTTKRNPRSHLTDLNALWDLRTYTPSQVFLVMQVLAGVGLPDGYRHMNAAAINAFKFVNDKKGINYVKFHLISEQGIKNLTVAEATTLSGQNPDAFIEDLYNSIEMGNYPSWKLMIQIMTPAQALQTKKYKYDPFDSTKEWLVKDFPLMPVGRLVFNRNPTDHFTEVEMIALAPSNLVPGIEVSPDPLLHGRVFSYPDAQRYRLGANFQNLEINKPIVPVNSLERDGSCAGQNGAGFPNYYPNSFECPIKLVVDDSAAESEFFLAGTAARTDTADDDNYSQPRLYYEQLSEYDRKTLIDTIAGSFLLIKKPIMERALQQFRNVSQQLADNIQRRMVQLMMANPA